jgi:tRNA threonylcarbamoyladenosine biosynthesis protein TsaB
MFLFIDTSNPETMIVALIDDKGKILIRKNIKGKYQQAEKLLPAIDDLIGGRKNAGKLKGIMVVKGPGSFTGLRIGITVANTMAFVLKIPVVGVAAGELKAMAAGGIKKIKGSIDGRLNQNSYVMPEYGAEPRITLKKVN